MKVSVVIPAFNEEKHLGKTLESLKRQTVLPDEVIVADNNSTDKTVEIALSYNARVIKVEEQGVMTARSAGFDKAKGEVILRTDADTILPHDWVERMKKHFEDPNVGRVTGPAVFYKAYLLPLFNLLVFWNNEVFGYKALFGPNMGIRKSVWEKVRKSQCGDKDQIYHEDLDFAIHSGQYGKYVRDGKIKVVTSYRRVANLRSFFITYQLKWFRTVFALKHLKRSLWINKPRNLV